MRFIYKLITKIKQRRCKHRYLRLMTIMLSKSKNNIKCATFCYKCNKRLSDWVQYKDLNNIKFEVVDN